MKKSFADKAKQTAKDAITSKPVKVTAVAVAAPAVIIAAGSMLGFSTPLIAIKAVTGTCMAIKEAASEKDD